MQRARPGNFLSFSRAHPLHCEWTFTQSLNGETKLKIVNAAQKSASEDPVPPKY